MKIFYRTLFVVAITTTAFFVWGKKTIPFQGHAEKEMNSNEVASPYSTAVGKPEGGKPKDSLPASSLRTAGTPVLSALKAVNKATARPGDTLLYTITVQNNGDEAAQGLTITDVVDVNTSAIPDSLWYSPVALDDAFTCIGNVGISVPAANGVLVNDQSGVPTATLKTFSRTTSKGGTITLNADGSFDYTPAPGYTGIDTIQYLLQNRVGTDVGVININISTAVWFINNQSAASVENGSLAAPYKTLNAFQAVNNGGTNRPKAGHTIFLYESNTAYNGSLTLLSEQKLIGQDATTSLHAIAGLVLPPFSKSLPALNAANATKVTLTSSGDAIKLSVNSTGNLIRGLTIGNTTNSGISGSSFGTLTLAENNITGSGQALSLSSGTLAIPAGFTNHFETLSSTSGAYGIYLNNVSGSLKVAAGALSGSTTTALYVSGGAITIQFPGNISGNRPVDIQNTNNSNIALSGTISSTSLGINLSGNSNSTLSFSGTSKNLNTGSNAAVNIGTNSNSHISFSGGGLVISTTTGDGFKAEGSVASLTVTGSGNTISVAGTPPFNGGTALHVSNATIGAAGLTFQSIASNNAQKGIYLNSTGTTGGLTVTGTGTTASGGTIQNCAQAGIEVNSAANLSLNHIKIFKANQNKTAQGGLQITTLNGTSQLESVSVTESGVRNGYIIHSSGAMMLRVKNCDFGFTSPTVANDLRQDCFEMRTKNNATATVILTNSQFKQAGTKGIQLFAENTSTMNASITGCTVDRMGGDMAGIEVGSSQTGTMKANVDGNPLINATNESAINVFAGGTSAGSKTEATIRNNNNISGAGNVDLYIDPVIQAFSNSASKGYVLVQNNVITNPDGQAVLTRTLEGTGSMDAVIETNTITISPTGFHGIEVRAGADAATPTTNRNCSYVHGNVVNNNGTQGGKSFNVQAVTPQTVVQLQQKSGANASSVAGLWAANTNTGIGTDSYTISGASLLIGTQYSCVLPTNLTAPTFVPQTIVETAGIEGIAETKTDAQNQETTESIPAPVLKTGTPSAAKMTGTLSGETLTVSNVNLPQGKKLVVQFNVRVNTPFPQDVCTISNQAEITGSNVTAVQTNRVVTNIEVKPVITACQADITVSSGTCTSTQSFAITASGCPAPTYTYYLVSSGVEITSPYAFPVGTTLVKAKASNVAGADSCTFTVTVTGTKAEWTGVTSTDWNTASNWSCNAVPDVNTDVTINSGPANMPVVSGNGGARNITLGTGASLTINSNVNFEVKGDFTSSGTIVANGTVSFSGTGNQTVPAAAFNHLLISGGGEKQLSGNVGVNGTLSFTAGMLLTGNHQLTLGAAAGITGADASAFIVTGGSGTVKKLGLGNGGSTAEFVFPVGVSAASYTPATISNAGVLDNFTLQVINNVYPSYTGTTPNGSPITTTSVNKTWFVSEDVEGGSVVTLSLQWNSSDELPGFDRSKSFVAHKTTDAWLPGPTANAAAGSAPSSYIRTWAGLTYFSPFGVGSTGSALPVQLINFKGYQTNGVNKLEWTVTGEQLQRYEIERSGSQTGFVKIAEVKAVGGAGQLSYQWQDASPLTGSNFYRLRMIHPDGKVTYSEVININRAAGAPAFAVYPTPVKDKKLHLQLTNFDRGTYAVNLYNAAGQVVFSRSMVHQGGSSVEMLSLPAALQKGAYIIHITGDGQQFTGNVLIQ